MKSNSLAASRRTFFKSGAVAGMAVGLAGLGGLSTAEADSDTGQPPPRTQRNGGTMINVPFERYDEVRIGIVGLGNRGMGMLGLFLAIPSVRITAICDIRAERTQQAAALVRAAGQPDPAIYTGGEGDYKSALEASRRARFVRPDPNAKDYRGLCARDDVDFVYTPTPWEWHFPVAMAAMRSGKHVGVELPLAMELSHLWQLVDTSEETRRHCIQLENVSYGRNELRLLRMAHAGLFGDLLHGAGAYIHDIRREFFPPHSTRYPTDWRRLWHTRDNTCLYPNHGLAPIAADMDINRGDRFLRLVSSSSSSLGLPAYREEHIPRGDPIWDEEYIQGDRNISLIETAKGRLIRLERDVSTPHPYNRLNHLAGTKGLFEDYPPRIYLEPDMSGDEWGDFENYAEYDHWLWKDIGGGGGGHGGIDYLLLWRLVQTMRLGLVPDIDVYDSATWSVPVPLSRNSIKRGGRPVSVPDFTRGHWEQYRPGLDSSRPESEGESAPAVVAARTALKRGLGSALHSPH